MAKFKSDEIGPWSEIKLEIIEKYAAAYTKILSNQKHLRLKYEYIDGFCGAGEHVSKKTKQQIDVEYIPMKNSSNAVVYYLFFASHKPVAKNIVEDIFGKYR